MYRFATPHIVGAGAARDWVGCRFATNNSSGKRGLAPAGEVLSYGDKKVPKETLPKFSPLRGALRCSLRSGVADRPSMA